MAEAPTEEMLAQLTKEAISKFAGTSDTGSAIDYLTQHPDQVSEFCLGIRDQYRPEDLTPMIQLGQIITDLMSRLPPKED